MFRSTDRPTPHIGERERPAVVDPRHLGGCRAATPTQPACPGRSGPAPPLRRVQDRDHPTRCSRRCACRGSQSRLPPRRWLGRARFRRRRRRFARAHRLRYGLTRSPPDRSAARCTTDPRSAPCRRVAAARPARSRQARGARCWASARSSVALSIPYGDGPSDIEGRVIRTDCRTLDGWPR